uniref:Glycosyltransferase family 92 protein n=1 Tax=Panagrolaimus sp. JU765 TaxID=591449 RepID=A0AC34R4B0_9BILA
MIFYSFDWITNLTTFSSGLPLIYTKNVSNTVSLENFQTNFFIRSAFRVSDEEIRLTIVKAVNNNNTMYYKYGKREGQVSLVCQLQQCPDPYYYMCYMNGYVGFIKNLTAEDKDDYLTLTSSANNTAEILITDVRANPILQVHKLGVCLQPIHLMTNYALFIQYFEYWLNEGVTKFFIYWESYTPEVKRILDFYKETSDADIELVTWSKLPSVPNITSTLNPNSYWFQLEVFLAIFDCIHRARHQVKFVSQTDLDEMLYVQNGSLIDFLENVDKMNQELAGMLFTSHKLHLPAFNDYKLSSPRDYSFEIYEKFTVDQVPSPVYNKLIYRPERVIQYHIHVPHTAEIIPEKPMERYKFIEIDPRQAVVWHLRRFEDVFKNNGTTQLINWKNVTTLWKNAFTNRLSEYKPGGNDEFHISTMSYF